MPIWPRHRLPAPMTIAISTPYCFTCLMRVAIQRARSGSMPKSASPESASPPSLSMMRWYLAVPESPWLNESPLSCGGSGQKERGLERYSNPLLSSRCLRFVSAVGRRQRPFAQLVAGEAAEDDVLFQGGNRLHDEIAHLEIAVLDVRLLEQHDVGIPLVEAALHDALDDVVGLALGTGVLLEERLLRFDGILRDVADLQVLRVGEGDVQRQVVRQLLEDIGVGDEVSLAVELQHHADARARVRVGLDAALVGLALGLLLRAGEALLHQVGLCLLKVTVELLQRLLAAENGCARLLAQLFHHLCCNGHVSFLVLI